MFELLRLRRKDCKVVSHEAGERQPLGRVRGGCSGTGHHPAEAGRRGRGPHVERRGASLRSEEAERGGGRAGLFVWGNNILVQVGSVVFYKDPERGERANQTSIGVFNTFPVFLSSPWQGSRITRTWP